MKDLDKSPQRKIEVLSPAASLTHLKAAVLSGCDSVYLGFGSFNARRNAINFTDEQVKEGIEFCHSKGVKVYGALNTLVSDREMKKALEYAKKFCDYDADALILQDDGLAVLIRQACPEMPLHASTQMSVHNLEGVKYLAKKGFSRVVLARELSLEDIKIIAGQSPIELEVFVHGSLCMSVSGKCYFSSVIGARSGNRGLCAQPCRLPYSINNKATYPLSLKDLCLLEYMNELKDIGIACVKIEGRMKSVAYVSEVTRIYSKAAKTGEYSMEDIEKLKKVFSRSGFTAGYYLSNTGKHMFGIRKEDDVSYDYKTIPANDDKKENSEKAPVDFKLFVFANKPTVLLAKCSDKSVKVTGNVPFISEDRALTEQTALRQLSKLGGTGYELKNFEFNSDGTASLPLSALNELRRLAVYELDKLKARQKPPEKKLSFTEPDLTINSANKNEKLINHYRFYSLNQFDFDNQEIYKDSVVWFSYEELKDNTDKIKDIDKTIPVGCEMPVFIEDAVFDEFKAGLEKIRDAGIKRAMIGNYSLLELLTESGFEITGSYALNIYNSFSVRAAMENKLKEAVLSFELSFSQIRDIEKRLPCGIIAYGYLPLMLTKNCVIKNSGECKNCSGGFEIKDRMGFNFSIIRDFGCFNTVLNSVPLYIADKEEYKNIGLSFALFYFTKENKEQIRSIIQAYSKGLKPDFQITRGLYLKGAL